MKEQSQGGMMFLAMEYFSILLLYVIFLSIYLWVLYFAGYGMDLTDEGFYVVSISNPAAYGINIPPSVFGFVYHWLYRALDGDIAMLRAANVLINGVLAWALSFLIFRRFWAAQTPTRLLLVTSAATSTLSLVMFGWWLLTPNYNGLAFQALMLTMIGVVIADESRGTPLAGAAWAIVAVGGWLCFMAKPTTAVAIALLVASYQLAFSRRSLPSMFAAAIGAIGLLAISAILIDGSVSDFIARLWRSVGAMSVLGSGQEMSTMLRLDRLDASISDLLALLAIAFLSFVAVALASRQSRIFIFTAPALLLVTATYVGISIWRGENTFQLDRSMLFLVPAAILFGAISYRFGALLRHLTGQTIWLGLIVLFLPYIYVLGSNGNYWVNGSSTALFWMLSATVLLSPLSRLDNDFPVLLLISIFSLGMTTAMLNGGMQNPYRQESGIRDNMAYMSFPGKGRLILSASMHNYLESAIDAAETAGFAEGQPVIDLTGRSPGLLYAMGAHGLGQPWLVGGYPGSTEMAISTLATEPCDSLAQAWLLQEPGGPRRLAESDVLAGFGASMIRDYAVIATFSYTPQPGGDGQPYLQNLLRPNRPAAGAIQACLDARE